MKRKIYIIFHKQDDDEMRKLRSYYLYSSRENAENALSGFERENFEIFEYEFCPETKKSENAP